MQYSLQKEGGAKNHWSEYLQTKSYSIHYKCWGIKRCEYLASEIRDYTHSEVREHDRYNIMLKMNGGSIRVTCAR